MARSVDGGASWALYDLGAALGTSQIRILAIDPVDPDRVFLRGIGASGDVLAVFDEATPPVAVPLTFANGQMTAFVRTASGTVLVAGTSSGVPQLFRSHDDLDFAPIAGAPAILSMAERQGVIYAATDTTVHPFGEALSDDDGATWTPGLRFAEIDAIAGCLAAACQDDCQMRAAQQQWPAAMCAAAPPADPSPVVDAGTPPPVADAAAPRPDAAAHRPDATVLPPLTDAVAPRDATSVHASADAGAIPQPGDAGHDVQVPPAAIGCSCTMTPAPGAGAVFAFFALTLALLRRRR